MKLEAFLTVGWEDNPQADFAAFRLHEVAAQSAAQGGDYSTALAAELEKAPAETVISGLGYLFRRRAGAFRPLKCFE